MIHSMSGGVLDSNEAYTFVKIEVAGAPYWFLSPTVRIGAGDRVQVTLNGLKQEGVVLRKETGTKKTAPLPLSRLKEIDSILERSTQNE